MSQGGHHLPVGIKRNLIKTCDVGHDIVIAQFIILCVFDERGLCRIAYLLAGLFGIFCIVTCQETLKKGIASVAKNAPEAPVVEEI